MNEQYDYDDIVDFLEDRMSEADRIVFEQALETDTALVQRVNVIRAEAKVHRMLRDAHIMRQFEDWDKASAEKKTDFSTSRQGNFDIVLILKKNRVLFAIGFLLLICVGTIFFIRLKSVPVLPVHQPDQPILMDTTSVQPVQPPLPNDAPVALQDAPSKTRQDQGANVDAAAAFYAALAKNTYRAGNFGGTLMGGGDANNQAGPYDQAVQLYQEKKYDQALNLLLHPTKDQEPEYLYLRGYVYYQLGAYRKAEQDFHAFRAMQLSDHKIDAVWREVFCMVKQLPGSRKRLDAALEMITADQEHNYYEEAVQLKAALKGKDSQR